MLCGYSSGWCEELFGFPLVTFEVRCRAKGDPTCTFVMGNIYIFFYNFENKKIGHPSKIDEMVNQYSEQYKVNSNCITVLSYLETKKYKRYSFEGNSSDGIFLH